MRQQFLRQWTIGSISWSLREEKLMKGTYNFQPWHRSLIPNQLWWSCWAEEVKVARICKEMDRMKLCKERAQSKNPQWIRWWCLDWLVLPQFSRVQLGLRVEQRDIRGLAELEKGHCLVMMELELWHCQSEEIFNTVNTQHPVETPE
jgi:hypothetical protein